MCARLLICTTMIAIFAMNQTDAALTMEVLQKTLTTLRNTCMSKTHADLEVIKGMQTGQFPEDNKPLKCYTLCALKSMRSFKGGRVDYVTMIKQMDLLLAPEIAAPIKPVTTHCASQPPADDECETSYQFVQCWYKTDKDNFFFP